MWFTAMSRFCRELLSGKPSRTQSNTVYIHHQKVVSDMTVEVSLTLYMYMYVENQTKFLVAWMNHLYADSCRYIWNF